MYYQKIYNIEQAASKLDLDLGRNNLYKLLKKHDVVDMNNAPYPDYVNKGLLVRRESQMPWTKRKFVVTMVTEKGLAFIKELYAKEKQGESSQIS